MERKKQDLPSLLEKFSEGIKKEIGTLNSRLDSLEEKKQPKGTFEPPVEIVPSKLGIPKTPMIDEDLDKFPVPDEYRKAVDETLSSEFKVFIKPSGDSPTFQLIIIVPEKYSNMSGAQRNLYRVDIRSKVLSLATGTEGVREYAKRILDNLGLDIRQKIIADKATKEAGIATGI